MSVQVRRRREAAAFLSTFVGAQGELLVDTTNNRLQVHDGATPGGWPMARLADLPSSVSPLALAQGGTGVDAASPAALLVALGVIGRTTVADAAYIAQIGDRTIAFTSLTAARSVSLPAASTFPVGTVLTVLDESGACSTSNTITLGRSGTDTINGAAAVAITTAYGYLALESNGAAKWTIVDSVPASSGGGGGTTAVANGGTGATSAAGARSNLGAAESGANGDITALANLSGIIDAAVGAARGSLLFRGSASWSALGPGTSGAVLTSNGSGADPSYQAVSGGSGSSNAAALTGTTLAGNVVSSALTSVGTLTGGGTGSGFTIALGSSTLTGSVSVANGGSGATSASAARTNLGAAASGANADITALSGLQTALTIAQGGTGATSGPAAAVALGLTGRTAVGDASVAATTASRTIAYTSLTAARTVTLPAASSFPAGTPLTVVDESGACSATNTITIAAAGSDKINGAASAILALAYGYLAIVSNGSNAWTIVDQSTAGMAQQAPGSVAITGGAINGTPLGQTTAAAVAATTLTATGAVSLPANSLGLATQAQAPAGTLRGNLIGSTANVADSALTAHIDAAFGSIRGSLLYRGISGWAALAPGTSGFVLTSNGSGTDPSYQAGAGGSGPGAPRSSIRQTVQGGPTMGGAPAFMPVGVSVNRDLVLHFDGANGATTTTDSGSGPNAPHTVSLGGTISTAQAKFGSSSLLCSNATNGASGALVTANTDTAFGTGDLTIEMWFYQTSQSNYQSLYSAAINNSTSDGLLIRVNTNAQINITTATQLFANVGSVSLNTWHHIAYARQSGTGRLFLDGTQLWSGADGTSYIARNFGIGRAIDGGSFSDYDFAGYIDEFATLKGTAAYTASFTPPSAAFANSPVSSSLTLTTLGVSASTPLAIAAANGFGATGQVDLAYQFTTNQSWSLTASATNYLAFNASTGATYVTTLVPIDQFGGTVSTANGQFTFDRQAMVGYLGNGTTAVATPLVFVGEAVAGSSTVVTATAYAYDGLFDSGWTAGLPPGAALTAVASRLGTLSLVGPRVIAECTTADNGYAAGDELVWQSASPSFASTQTRNSAGAIVTSSGWPALNKSTAAAVYLTASAWKYKIVHARGW